MRLRKLALVVGLASVLGSEMAIALGLGEIKLNSTLNQPLNAEIKLLQTRDLVLEEILVGLAGKDDFKNAGVDRVFFLADLKFQIITPTAGGPVVRVTSKKPVLEPYLNFLVETQWPTGRILREYTLLMDLPVFNADTAKPMTSTVVKPKVQAQSSQAATQSLAAKVENVEAPLPQQSQSGKASTLKPAAGESVQVKSNDTLWEIALKVRPSKQFSVQQTMLAIQRLNPDAFINDNINLLKKGQVLRVPAEDQIRELSSLQATIQVAQQNNQWAENANVSGPQLEGRKQYASSSAKKDTIEGRLTLASSGTSEGSGKSSGSKGSSEHLQIELAISLEELDKSRRNNSELNDRVAELEEQIATMERLVDVSSQELRALQLATQGDSQNPEQIQKANESRKSSVTDLMNIGVVTPAADSPDDVRAEAADGAFLSRSEEALLPGYDAGRNKTEVDSKLNSAVLVVAEQPKEPAKVTEQPKEPSIVDVLMENIVLIGAALLAILLAIFFLFRKRDSKEEVELSNDASGSESADDIKAFDSDDIKAFDPEENVEVGLENLELEENLSGIDEEDDVALELDDDSFTPESETGDAVAEADIYIAYGKFDQAEEMLLKALSNDGTSTAVSLKLLEVYAETKELDKFDGQYEAVLGAGEAANIQRANVLRGQFVDAPVFDSSSVDTADESSNDLDFDLGDGLDLATDSTLENLSPAEDMEDLDLDFNLDFDESTKSSDDAEEFDLDLDAEEDTAVVNDFALDFDANDSSAAPDEEIDLDLSEDFSLNLESVDETLGLDVESLGLDGDDDFLDADAVIYLENSELDSIELDLRDMEPNDKLEVSIGEPAALELPEFEEGEIDMSSLDEEMEALSSNMGLANEEFGEDDDIEDFATEFDLVESEPEVQELSSIESSDVESESGFPKEFESTDIELPIEDELVFETSDELDIPKLSPIEPNEFESESDFLTEFESIDLDLSAEDDLVSETSDTSSDDLYLAEDDLVLENSVEESAVEEFDLAADLGLDVEDLEDQSDEDVFSKALSDIPESESEVELESDSDDSVLSEDDLEAELDFLSDSDEAGTKLDLARAYIDMGDKEGAKDILDEVAQEGNDQQKGQAEELLSRL